jgi:acyl carrier protein
MTDVLNGDTHDIEATILDFIHRELVATEIAVNAQDDLLTGELLDSLAILRLATYVDEKFKIEMQPSDFQIDNFQSVAALTQFVIRSRGSTGGRKSTR